MRYADFGEKTQYRNEKAPEVSYRRGMEDLQSGLPADFKAGQIWHVNNRYVSISGVGKRLVHYRMLKQRSQSSAAAHVASKQELQAYFERHSAQEVILWTKP